MSNVTVCVRFRPLSARESEVNSDDTCLHCLDSESFAFKAEKGEELVFCFDRVFYQDSEQADVYKFLALPVVQDTLNAVNGTIITYGQTGAGKTYSMEGVNILDHDAYKKGLLPRVVDSLFSYIDSSEPKINYTVKLSMVEIYMERIRDLFDLSKENLQIMESKTRGIFLSGATEMAILDPEDALRCLSRGIGNRSVGETQMNMASSRSHCVYIFSVQQESSEGRCLRTGKLVLIDLAGSEKVDKTGAEGKVLKEAKTINKSLSALGNVINALTTGKANHIPYRDSKLTRILQDAVSGNSRTALLCCCSPSSLNSSESLSTLRFGSRMKLIKTLRTSVDFTEDRGSIHQVAFLQTPKTQRSIVDVTEDLGSVYQVACLQTHKTLRNNVDVCEDKGSLHQVACLQTQNGSHDILWTKLKENLTMEDVKLLEEVCTSEDISFDPHSAVDLDAAFDSLNSQIIESLQQAVKDLGDAFEELLVKNKTFEMENRTLKEELARHLELNNVNGGQNITYFGKLWHFFSFIYSLLRV